MKTINVKEFKNNELIALRNKVEIELQMRAETTTCLNKYFLLEMLANLLDGVGEGLVKEDYYASQRYYSTETLSIPGVKNIRIGKREKVGVQTGKLIKYNAIVVKVTDPRGFLLPNAVRFRNQAYIVEFRESKNFEHEVKD